MERFFNTAGPCDPRFHYMLPAAERLPGAPRLIKRGGYFVVHAPRQTGKTTTLRALAKELTAKGHYTALHFSCETGKVARDDHVAAQKAVLAAIRHNAFDYLPESLQPPDPWPAHDDARLLASGLSAWARSSPRPLVLFFDEIDALRGDSLLSVLGQLRDGYPSRPDSAPWSVVLCGLRDVRDYKAAAGGDPNRLGTSSPFNIKIESIRLGNFTANDVASLYAQHTQDTGQPFTDEAVEHMFALSQGQPWLANALAYEIIDNMELAPLEPITAAHVETAKEQLILTRATHLDSLIARLTEPRVRHIIEPLMAGKLISELETPDTYHDDVVYVRDLGLIAEDPPTRPANPIYREVMARALAAGIEARVYHEPKRFIRGDGTLDLRDMLEAFAEFWREHGEVLTSTLSYHEVAPQLILMAFLQRIVNGGGFVEREYGIGRGRIDLLIRWPYKDETGTKTWQREAIELKVWREKKTDPLSQGLAQLDDYLARLDLDRGVLVIFDRRPDAPEMTERIAWLETETTSGRSVTVLRL